MTEMESRAPSTICLNMIVKNEAPVIQRCLESVLPLIDSWVVVDTGSTDGTQDIVRRVLCGVPGTIHEREWRNFGHNRTEAAALARSSADYLLFIDADDELVVGPNFDKSSLSAQSYRLLFRDSGTTYWRPALVSTALEWRFVGVLHEYLDSDDPHSHENLATLSIIEHRTGARSRGITQAEKYARDAETLERALESEPDNARYVFYLAQSYRDSFRLKNALKAYQKRAAMGGWEEEAWYALYQVARLSEQLKLGPELIVQRYLEAYARRPSRAEPLVELARFYRERKQWPLAHLFAKTAVAISRPSDILFVDSSTYEWRALDEFAIASYWVGDYAASATASKKLLASAALPSSHLARVTENLNFAIAELRKHQV